MTTLASPPSDGPELDLELPAKPAFVRTARHAVAALARMHDLPDDVIEDVRIAVSEGCTAVLRAAYTDASGTFVLTAGVAVMRSAAAADRAVTSLTAQQAHGGVNPVSFPGTSTAAAPATGPAVSMWARTSSCSPAATPTGSRPGSRRRTRRLWTWRTAWCGRWPAC